MAAADPPASLQRQGGHVVAHAVLMLRQALALLLCRSGTFVRRVVPVLGVTVAAAALALAPLPMVSAHAAFVLSAAESDRNGALVALEIAEHGHSHDDGETHEQSGGHMHGHDPADHSHQFGFFTGSASHWGLPAPQLWPSSRSGQPDPAAGSGIDRPPKQSIAL